MIYKFKPLFKQTLWGGNRILPFKRSDEHLRNVGESWEISAVENNETVVAEGPEAGQTITELVRHYKGQLVGEENYERFGDEFPLLVKFIDARHDLSIQVHPTDEVARRHGYPHGKTEMWYAMESSPSAKLYNGLSSQLSPEEYKAKVADDTICDALNRFAVREGDCFYIPSGRIHSIGAGCFLAEIQQTSDVTYRIYDFKRRDKDGKFRELHTQQAAETIDYMAQSDNRICYQPLQDEGVQLVSCPYFTTAVYDLNDPMTLDYSELDSFVILVGLRGSCELIDDTGAVTLFREGETVLIPATARIIKVEGTIKFLETYV